MVIFKDVSDNIFFLSLMEKIRNLTGIRILAYCLMNNHYHIVLQNNTLKMSEFFKQLNGQYARYYRIRYGGKGYVFQNRYKSPLIQDEGYLIITIAYVLQNPVKAGFSHDFKNYSWSSINRYFKKSPESIIDNEYIEGLFENKDQLFQFVSGISIDELPIIETKLGTTIGGTHSIPHLRKQTERRSGRESMERRRMDDKYFDPMEKVFQEFEKKHKIKIDNMDVRTYHFKRLRGELLVYLKERSGLTYREIVKLDLFSDLSINSLGTLYKRNRKRIFNWKYR